jgi:TP901 family phage tail tape measure protein
VAERTVAVKLSAKVDAYVAAMKRAEMSTTGFSRATQRNLKTVGGSMQTLGKGMTMAVSLPIAALGAASTKMAMDWETSFAQMVGLANVPAEEVDNLKESVLALAGETATAPQELADGLYLAASAGLDSATALEVVEMSARASAAGMGDTATVVDLLTSVLGSYGDENISAARAADILAEAVAQGKAAPDAMAQSLGNVLPIAASLGVEFEEVAGSVAFLTNNGLAADEAVTALRGTLLAMIDPTKAANAELEKHGTSAAELKAAVDEGGLLGALELLRTHGFEGNSEAMSNLFEDNRALVGATALLNDESGKLVPIIDAVTSSVGKSGEAFDAVAGTDAFKMEQALADVQVAMTELGAILLPIAADIAGAIADLASWFADLPPVAQEVITVLGGIGLVAGPLIFIVGSLVKNFVAIRGAMLAMSGPALAASAAMAGIGAALVVGFLAYQEFTSNSRAQEAATKASTAALNTQFPALLSAAVAAARAGEEVDALAVANEALSMALSEGEGDVLRVISQFNMGAEDMLGIITQMESGGAGLHQTWVQLAESFGLNHVQAGKLANVYASMPLTEIADNAEVLAADIGITTEELGFLTSNFFALGEAVESADVEDITRQFLDGRVAALGFEDSLVKAAEAAAGTTRLEDPIAVYQALTQEILNASDAELTAAGITDQVTAEMALLAPGVAAVSDEFGTLEVEALTGSEAMGILAESFENLHRNMASGRNNTGMNWASIDLFGEALSEVTDIQREYVSSADAVWESALTFGESIDENSRSLAQNSVEGLHNRGVIADWAGDILAHSQAQLAAGESTADVTEAFKHNRQAMIDAAIAAGFEKEEIDILLDSLGMADADWTAVLKVSGEQLAMKKIELMLLDLEKLDEGTVAEVNAILETDGAWAAYHYLYNTINGATPTMNARIRYPKVAVTVSGDGRSVSVGTYGHAVAARKGAYIGNVPYEGVSALLHSNEAVLPLGDPSRMAAILGMPQVFGPVAKAMAGMAGGASGARGGDVYNVNVHNHGRDLTPADVARAIEMSRRAA